MFKKLSELMGSATISMTITKTGGNELTVSITPKSEGSEISPVIASGSPEELDEKLFDSISGFIQDSNAFILKKDAAKRSLKEKADKKAADKKAAESKTTSTKPAEKKSPAKEEPVKAAAPEEKAPAQEVDLFSTLI